MSSSIATHREETVQRIHRKCAHNAHCIGQLKERMFFSVVNHDGRAGKTLFDNPADYARCVGVVLHSNHHARFKSRVRTFLTGLREHDLGAMRALNPTWETYRVEVVDEFVAPTDDICFSANDTGHGQMPWTAQVPPSGLWADYDE